MIEINFSRVLIPVDLMMWRPRGTEQIDHEVDSNTYVIGNAFQPMIDELAHVPNAEKLDINFTNELPDDNLTINSPNNMIGAVGSNVNTKQTVVLTTNKHGNPSLILREESNGNIQDTNLRGDADTTMEPVKLTRSASVPGFGIHLKDIQFPLDPEGIEPEAGKAVVQKPKGQGPKLRLLIDLNRAELEHSMYSMFSIEFQ